MADFLLADEDGYNGVDLFFLQVANVAEFQMARLIQERVRLR